MRVSRNDSHKVFESTRYYIRLSVVLGGEVISEGDGPGRTKKTYVIAAGAKIATESEFTYIGNTTQSVNWEHTDASGMSYRSTTSNGTAISGDGGEGSPVEADPMGGNVGTSTPYVETVQPWQPPEGYENALLVIGDESPMYVDGQRVTCNLDGLAIGCSQAMGMLDHGSAIPAALAPYQNLPGFQFNSYGLGIFNATYTQFAGYSLGYGNGDRSDWITFSREAAIARMEGGETLIRNWLVTDVTFFANVSWQTRLLVPLDPKKTAAINNAVSELAERLKQGKVSADCQKNVIDKLKSLDGFSLDKFIDFLEQGGDFYDGEKSGAPVADYDALDAPPGGWTISVAQRFALPGQDLHAFTANRPNFNRFTVFFDPDRIETKEKLSQISGQKLSGLTTSNLAFFFHEGLHGFGNSIGKLAGSTGYGDTSIQNAFELPTGGGSKNISDYIEQNCFK